MFTFRVFFCLRKVVKITLSTLHSQNLLFNILNILTGQDAKPGVWPWMAALWYPVDGDMKLVCGGTIVSDIHILTAAHCVSGYDKQLFQIRLGDTNKR